MWLAVLMLAAMASGSLCPDNCQCRSPRVECRGHAPYIAELDRLADEFTELAIRDVADSKELRNRMSARNSSFLKGLQILEVINVTSLKKMYDVEWYEILIERTHGYEEETFLNVLPNVRVLNFSHNSLRGFPNRHSDLHSRSSSQLRVLDIGHNKIKSIDSSEFWYHQNITWLNMANNEIDDIHPESFRRLELLEYLDLSNNNLHTLEGALNTLVSLQRLFLAGNKLENIGTSWFQNLTILVELDISRNKLVLIPPDALKSLTNLLIFKIDDNPLIEKNFSLLFVPSKQSLVNTAEVEHPQTITTSTTPTITKPSNFECPQYCQCRSPRVECHGHVPESIQTLNQLSDDFTELIISNIENKNDLIRLRSENSSSFLNRLVLLEITKIPKLLDYYNLKWWHNNLIPNVRSLNVSYNGIEEVPYYYYDYKEPNRLRVLDLGYNNINEIRYRILRFPNLTWLNLANNKINYIHREAFSKIKSLEYLDLSNNMLYTLEGTVNPLISLQRLFLAGNKLEHIGSTWFQNLTKLTELDISRNKLTFILADPLQPLASLSVLKLAENPLIKRDLSLLLSTGKRLEIVDASRIGLIRVPAALTHSIRILKLAGNQLTSINSGDLDSYPLLRELDLSDNRLVSIEEDALGRLDNLEELNLSGNILSTIPKSLPNGLKTLDLSQNALSNLKVNDLQNLHLLTALKLSGNVITDIEGGFFRQLIALKTLDISDNPFIKLPSDTLNGPSNLIVLRMSGLTSLKTEENQNQDTAFPFLTPENLVKLDVSRSPALAAQLLADNAALSACKSLQELDLAYTSINSIRSDLAYVLPQLQKLNLLGNDWNCSEDQLWLGEWIRQHNASIEFSARCKTPSQIEGNLLHHVISAVSTKEKQTKFSTVAPATITPKKTDNVPLTTDIAKEVFKLTTESSATYITTSQYNSKIKSTHKENKVEINTTQVPESIKRKSRNLSTTSNEKESLNISTVAYAKEQSSNADTLKLTKPSIQSTTQINTMKNNQNKHLEMTEPTFTLSTIGDKLNKKEAGSVYNTTPLLRDTEETRKNVSSTPSPTTVHTTTTDVSSSTTEKVLLSKLKQSTSVKFEEITASPKPKEIKEDIPVHAVEKKTETEDQHKSGDRAFSEFSHSKLLFANEETHPNEEPSSFAEELRNSQASEPGARTSESLASGAHPGMLVLLGAAIVAAAALTVILSRRATVNRRERLYQRHENIEVHALTPTTELW